MGPLISKEEVVKLLAEELDVIEDCLDSIAVTITRKRQNEYAKAILSDILDEVNTMEEIENGEPEPAIWIEGKVYKGSIECRCSKCNQSTVTPKEIRMDYCPYCGSHMSKNAGGGVQ